MKHYFRFDFNISPYNEDAADLLAAFLADEGFESFEKTDDGMSAYIQKDNLKEGSIESVISGFPFEVNIKWEKQLIENKDWNEEWEKKYFKPLVLASGKCVIHSSFHADYPKADYEIVIDPKMAFGTGHHATTSMMVNHLFEINPAGKKLIDMGTGTAILAILAKKLGSKEAIGVEIDPGAYENAIENASINNVEIDLRLGDVKALEDECDADIFLANINRNIILADLENYLKTLKPGGILIISGFYESDVPLLEAALKENGMKIEVISTEGDGWCSIRAYK